MINKKSGVQGISGVSSDFRELQAAMEKGNEKAALALDVFCYNVKKYIGAYAAVLNGVDLISSREVSAKTTIWCAGKPVRIWTTLASR